MNIFMYATHPTLVDHESQLFHNLGFDVYTAAWATKTRSDWCTDDVYFNKKHFFQGENKFSNLKELEKLNVSMRSGGTDPVICDVLLSNFDILYVSQITPWLMDYAPQFLDAGKIVLFRTFGYNLTSWGSPHSFENLYKHEKFYILPTDKKEINLGIFNTYPKVRHIMASVCEELIDKKPKSTDEKFAITVLQTPIEGEDFIHRSLDHIIDVKIINRQRKFINYDEYNQLYSDCTLYLDFVENLLRYSVFEALLHDKPILVMQDGDMYKFMFNTKLACPIDCYHNGLGDTLRLKFFVDNPHLLDDLAICQRQWFNLRIEEMLLAWKGLFEEVL